MKVKKRTSKNNSTDIALMVESTTQEEFFEFDENKIAESLIKELDCPEDMANEISKTVGDKLKKLELTTKCCVV